MAVDRDVIESALDEAVQHFLDHFGHKEILPGWRALFLLGFEVRRIGEVHIPAMQDKQVENLIVMSEIWTDAFDAASYLAGIAVCSRLPISAPLRRFAGEVLMGERKRPVQIGRPLSDKKFQALWQYALVHFLHKEANLPVARNRENKNNGERNFNACEAVAAAFTRAGKRTTFNQVASLVYDTGHADLRETARALGLLEFNPPDTP